MYSENFFLIFKYRFINFYSKNKKKNIKEKFIKFFFNFLK